MKQIHIYLDFDASSYRAKENIPFVDSDFWIKFVDVILR